jgi:P-type Ca2+ transporter type 2C
MNRVAWHSFTPERAIERLASSRLGLAPDEAARRLEDHGPNRLRVPPPVSAWKILLAQ